MITWLIFKFLKWLGSKLAFAFDDFRIDPSPGLVLFETNPFPGLPKAAVYKWNGFGFIRLKELDVKYFGDIE